MDNFFQNEKNLINTVVAKTITVLTTNCNEQGNLLRGINICSGAALKAIRQLLTTSFKEWIS
jgi:hypothetical protein